MPLYPSERDDSGRPDPRVMFVWRGNYFNQAKGNIAVEEELWPKLDLVVDINFRMDSTALNSDIVLPTASHYEKHDLSETDMHTYVHPFTPAVEPLGESKTDWQIFRDLAAKIQELAADRGTEPVDDRKFDRQIDLQSVHDDYVRDWLDDEPGALSEDKAAAEFILENSEETNPEGTDEQITFDEIDEQPKRLLETGDHWSSDIEEGEAYTPWKDYVQDKNPWPTFTGRQQYYIDHDWFLELDEQLPTHKEAPVLQEKSEYPLGYNTPHSRCRSTRRGATAARCSGCSAASRPSTSTPTTPRSGDRGRRHRAGVQRPRLGRGAGEDLPERGARHRPALLQLGAVPVPDRNNFNSLVPMYMKPTQLVQYPEDTGEHLHFFPNYWGPTGVNSDVRIEVEKVEEGQRRSTPVCSESRRRSWSRPIRARNRAARWVASRTCSEVTTNEQDHRGCDPPDRRRRSPDRRHGPPDRRRRRVARGGRRSSGRDGDGPEQVHRLPDVYDRV